MSRWRWFRSGWDTAIFLPPRIFIRIWTTLPRFLRQKRCWTGLEWVQIRKMTLKKVWFLSRTGRFLSCYEIVKLKNSVFCIKNGTKCSKKHAVPLIGGASEIWTLAALQTPYRISSFLVYIETDGICRKKAEAVGRWFDRPATKNVEKEVLFNVRTSQFEPVSKCRFFGKNERKTGILGTLERCRREKQERTKKLDFPYCYGHLQKCVD